MFKRHSRKLATRLMAFILVSAIAIMLVATGVQLKLAYDRDVQDIEQRFKEVIDSDSEGITANVWLLDTERLEVLLQGVARMPGFQHTEVVDDKGAPLLSLGEHISDDNVVIAHDLNYDHRGEVRRIGAWTLSINNQPATEQVVRNAISILGTNAIIIFVVAVIIYIAVARMITRHMESMASYARRFSMDKLNVPLELDRRADVGTDDELADMVTAINTMRENLRDSYDQLQNMNAELEARVEGRTRDLSMEILERKKAEVALLDALELNEKITEESAIGIALYDETGQCIFANAALADFSGGTVENLMQQNYHDIPSWRSGGLDKASVRALEENATVRMEVNTLSSFGKPIHLDCYLSPVRASGKTHLMLMVNDISTIKEAEAEIRALSERNQLILEAAGDGIYGVDLDGKCTFINPVATEMLGWSADEIIGQNQHELLHHTKHDGSHYPREECPIYDAFRDGAVHNVSDEVFWRKDGTSFAVEYTSTPLWENDTITGSVVVFRDITERKHVQAQLFQSSKLATLGEMATGVAHEINQPLNVIRLSVDNILRKMKRGAIETEYLEGKVERVKSQVERASAIINHMRVFGRRVPDAPERIDLRSTVEGAIDLIGEQLHLANIQVEIDVPKAPVTVLGHQVQFEQIILNLIANARDAIQNGEGEKRAISICIDDDVSQGQAVLSIHDTGGGIPEAVLERIFEPFFTTKEVGEGTGLGLSITYGIVKDAGGEISASNVDGGAKFEISIPLAGQAA